MRNTMKNTMKYIKQFRKLVLAPVILVTVMISSCTDIIDTSPYSSIDENAAFSTPSLCDLSVTGMYQAAQRGDYGGAGRGYPFGAAFVEQGDCRGEDVVNIAAFYQYTYEGTYTTGTANNVWMWSDTYRLINRANIVLEGAQIAADNGVITQAKADEYKGEALAFRAMAHHLLLVHFSRPYKDTPTASHWGVPYRKIPNNTPANIETNAAMDRGTVAQCYTDILADLNEAENLLPLKAARSGKTAVTRWTKQAAAAMKTRVYLHMYDWNNVITEAKKFETGGTYAGTASLEASPNGAFAALGYSTKENLISIENSATNNPTVNGALASQYKRRQLVCISPIAWRNPRWLADDKRRTSAVASSSGVVDAAAMVFTTGTNSVRFTNKYKDEVGYSDGSPMIRYAEVLLNAAEAYARNNDVTNGLANLNLVRNRALADPVTQAYTAASFADNVELLGAILDERRIELVMEGQRWSDISRLQFCPYFPIAGMPGKLANAMPANSEYTLGTPYTGPYGVTAKPYTDNRFLWPLPAIETNANPVLAAQQNPGY
jgi:hypothetical protein